MKPPRFAYVAPETVDEATALLAEYGDDAQIIAGGQSLMPMLAFRMARPAVLIDIARVAELANWRCDGDGLHIGATLRQRALLEDDDLAGALPLCTEAAQFIGHPATRSRGTIVGSLCHADPAAELPVCATVLGAAFKLRSASGERCVTADAFFEAALSTSIGDEEMVTSVLIPPPPPRSGYAFLEIARRHGDFALVAVGCVVTLDETNRLAAATIALGGVDDTPRAFTLDELAAGNGMDGDRIAAAADAIAGSIEPGSDIHASADYRRALASVLSERAMREAIGRAERIG